MHHESPELTRGTRRRIFKKYYLLLLGNQATHPDAVETRKTDSRELSTDAVPRTAEDVPNTKRQLLKGTGHVGSSALHLLLVPLRRHLPASMRLLERLVHVLIVAVGTTCLLQAAALSNSRHAHFLATVFGSDHLTQVSAGWAAVVARLVQ